MHISDGILSSTVVLSTAVVGGALCIYSLKKSKNSSLALIASMGAIFFIASFVHIPIGPTQIHLLLIGIIGILLAEGIFMAIFMALLLQALLLGFGGLSSLGANLILMALPSFLLYVSVKKGWLNFLPLTLKYFAIGFLPVFFSTLLLALFLALSKQEYLYASGTLFLANIPAMIIEGLVTIFLINYLKKSTPELLQKVGL